MSLRNLLWEIYNQVEVLCYRSMSAFIKDSNRHFVHFFVNSDILFSHIEEFETLRQQTSVISIGPDRHFTQAGYNVLDVSLPEPELTDRLMNLQFISNFLPDDGGHKLKRSTLSEREKEVLVLIIKGFINKEIAQKLNISTTTVIFHRNNICEKLRTRSIGRLTIFAVLAGIVDINDI